MPSPRIYIDRPIVWKAVIAMIAALVVSLQLPVEAGVWRTEWLYIPDQFQMTDYRRIEIGMTYQAVVAILGTEGKETGRSAAAGGDLVIYTWQNESGTGLTVTFHKSRVLSKAQAGL